VRGEGEAPLALQDEPLRVDGHLDGHLPGRPRHEDVPDLIGLIEVTQPYSRTATRTSTGADLDQRRGRLRMRVERQPAGARRDGRPAWGVRPGASKGRKPHARAQ
jgi:hypothetical protein